MVRNSPVSLPSSPMHRVADLPQVALVLVVDHFEIADGGLAARAPVDDVGAAIDEPLLVEADEGLAHRHREALVHGEVFAVPVDRGAEALHLVENGSAVVAPPLPHALDEGLAAHLLPRGALADHLPLHQHLGGDAGVIGAGNPQNPLAAHAAPAGQDVALRVLEHVAHVQVAGHVGRRQQNGKGGLAVQALVLVCGRGRRLGEELFAHPVFGPVIFNGGRVVGFGQVVGHGVDGEPPDVRQTPSRKGFERGDHPSL